MFQIKMTVTTQMNKANCG